MRYILVERFDRSALFKELDDMFVTKQAAIITRIGSPASSWMLESVFHMWFSTCDGVAMRHKAPAWRLGARSVHICIRGKSLGRSHMPCAPGSEWKNQYLIFFMFSVSKRRTGDFLNGAKFISSLSSGRHSLPICLSYTNIYSNSGFQANRDIILRDQIFASIFHCVCKSWNVHSLSAIRNVVLSTTYRYRFCKWRKSSP